MLFPSGGLCPCTFHSAILLSLTPSSQPHLCVAPLGGSPAHSPLSCPGPASCQGLGFLQSPLTQPPLGRSPLSNGAQGCGMNAAPFVLLPRILVGACMSTLGCGHHEELCVRTPFLFAPWEHIFEERSVSHSTIGRTHGAVTFQGVGQISRNGSHPSHLLAFPHFHSLHGVS
jgi:hypothetical protein